MTRLLCLKAADMMDRAGNKAAQGEIAMIKVAAPLMALKIIDDAIQAFGAAGVSEDAGLARAYAVDPHAAARRRAGRGPPPRDRPAGVQEAPMSEQAIDEDALGRWLEANVEGFLGPFELTKFPSGQSNPTYRIRAASGDYVLRRKPFGQLLPSAHAVDREYRLLSALHPLGFPVPRAPGPVRGSGRHRRDLLRDGAGAGPPLRQRRAAGVRRRRRGVACTSSWSTRSPTSTTSIPRAAGLGDFGKPGNYFERQVMRWTRQYRDSQTDDIPEMERLIAFLPETIPEQSRTSIVHGDYRIDNVVFDGDGTLTAVLDWELATLGDPVADFSYLAMQWMMPADGGAGLAGSISPRSAFRASTRSSRAIRSGRACPSAASSTGISPTTSSAWPASSRASRSA